MRYAPREDAEQLVDVLVCVPDEQERQVDLLHIPMMDEHCEPRHHGCTRGRGRHSGSPTTHAGSGPRGAQRSKGRALQFLLSLALSAWMYSVSGSGRERYLWIRRETTPSVSHTPRARAHSTAPNHTHLWTRRRRIPSMFALASPLIVELNVYKKGSLPPGTCARRPSTC